MSPTHTRVLLHTDGPALWPDQKSAVEVLRLRETTIPSVWYGTYQGTPTAPQGTVFRRAWWRDQNRYDWADRAPRNQVVGRWISWDTAKKSEKQHDYSAAVVGELLPDYRLVIREVFRDRLEFPDLPEEIKRQAERHNQDGKLRGVLIEDKASGTSAYQTLVAASEPWLAKLLIAFMPHGDKTERADQGAVWCRNGCVLLPHPGMGVPWLSDFEDEIFNFPSAAHDDQVDGLSQLLIYLENILSEGFHARNRGLLPESA